MQLIDLHCDTIYELKRRDDGSSLAKNSLSIDLDGMRRAGTILQIFACFIYRKEWKTWEDGYAEVFRLIDRMDRERKIKTRSGSCTMEVKFKRTENAERYQQWYPWKRAVFWTGSRNV